MKAEKNIVITGFMGSGKTTVGEALARKLDREFVDMDAEIERRTGMSIPEIFRRKAKAPFATLSASSPTSWRCVMAW